MGAVAFDTLKFVETLTSGGVKEDEAKAIATAYRDASGEQQLVTKNDLKTGLDEVRAEIAGVRAELKAEIAEVKTELKAEIAEVRAELKSEIASVKSELKENIADVKHDLLKWIIGLALAQFAVLVGLTLKIH
ncbi:MAG: CCDC90 family protein [Gallionellaceae bacterium]|jgi:uncharacterized protein involved in exopolysaccharide biosynthesis|nr:CCDC90 family protein [Gallionellaceae bacterium]